MTTLNSAQLFSDILEVGSVLNISCTNGNALIALTSPSGTIEKSSTNGSIALGPFNAFQSYSISCLTGVVVIEETFSDQLQLVGAKTNPLTGRKTFSQNLVDENPRNYPGKNIGVLLNDFTTATGMAYTGSAGVSGNTDMTFPTPEGRLSTWVNCPYASAGYARMTLTKNMLLAATDSISLRVYVENPSSLRYLSIMLLQSSTGANISKASSADGTYEAGGFGWYNITWKLSDFTVSGVPNYSAVFDSFRLQIGNAGSGGGQGRIAISDLRKNAQASSYILFSQDHGYDSAWAMRDLFSTTGIPLNIYLNAGELDTSGNLTTAQARAMYDHESNSFEIASYPDYLPSLNHTLTGISASQAVAGAGNLTLNGSLCTAGTANLGAPRKVVISTASVNKTVGFTITGTLGGNAVTESMVGSWVAGGYVESTNYYDTVTQIAVGAAITGNCTVGTSYSVTEHSSAISANVSGLSALGFTGSEKNIAYSAGQISQPLFEAMTANGVKTGRHNLHTQSVPRNMLLHDKSWNPHLLSAWNAGAAIATLLSMVDDIVSRGGVLVFYFHEIASVVDGVNPTAEDLATLVAYAKSKQDAGSLRCLKLSELCQIYDSSVNRV